MRVEITKWSQWRRQLAPVIGLKWNSRLNYSHTIFLSRNLNTHYLKRRKNCCGEKTKSCLFLSIEDFVSVRGSLSFLWYLLCVEDPRDMASFAGTTQKCKACEKTVYLVDQLTADNKVYHKACFRCHHCKGTLKVTTIHPLALTQKKNRHFSMLNFDVSDVLLLLFVWSCRIVKRRKCQSLDFYIWVLSKDYVF